MRAVSLFTPASAPPSTVAPIPYPRLVRMFRVVNPALGSIALRSTIDPRALRDRFEAAGTTLIEVRHGASSANGKPKIVLSGGGSESPLTRDGTLQAAAAARSLYDGFGGDRWLIDVLSGAALPPIIYSSPLSRAYDTGLALSRLVIERATILGASVEEISRLTAAFKPKRDPRLLEMQYGRFELRELEQLGRELPKFLQSWDGFRGLGVNFLDRFPGGEGRIDVLARIEEFLSELPTRHRGRTVLVFSHLEAIAMSRILLGDVSMRNGQVRVVASSIPNATPIRLA